MQQDEFRLLGGKILGGRTYSLEEYPHWWQNEAPLLYPHLHIMHSQLPFIDPQQHERFIKANSIDTAHFPVERFPLIEDFEVILWANISNHNNEESRLTYMTRFFSPSHGFLVRLRFWDYTPQDLCQDDFRVPSGDFQMPYFDFDQAWAVLIAELDEFIYILMGKFEDVLQKQGYSTWFKVKKSCYYSQWEKAIQLCRHFCGK